MVDRWILPLLIQPNRVRNRHLEHHVHLKLTRNENYHQVQIVASRVLGYILEEQPASLLQIVKSGVGGRPLPWLFSSRTDEAANRTTMFQSHDSSENEQR
jgi:hypothetical protein